MKKLWIAAGLLAAVALILLRVTTKAPSSKGAEEPADLPASLAGTSCELWNDEQGLTHTRTQDAAVALGCLGYLHGRDRAFQMDYLRRTAQGRVSEIYGKDYVRSDFQMRLMGLADRAREIFSKMGEARKRELWIYSHGVNLGFREALRAGVYEFKAQDYSPENWIPADTLAMMLLQAFDQTRKTFTHDLDEAAWLTDFGKSASSLFSDDNVPWKTTVLKPGEFPVSHSPVLPKMEEASSVALPKSLVPLSSGVGEGSNNWVVSPRRSKTGHAWLANDPHLQLRHPPFWYWAHLSGGIEGTKVGIDAIGASLPGVPVIVSGTNRHLAWGLTNSYLDVADVSLIPQKDLADARVVRPLIWVKFWKFKLPFLFKTYQWTRQGWPVLPLDAPTGQAIVLRWTGFDLEPHDFDGLFELMGTSTTAEADRALSHIGIPSWNFVFADNHGSIGYRAVGRVPRHQSAPPFGLPQRELKELEAWPLLSREEMPHVMNPTRGFVATANNRQWPAEAAFNGGRGYSSSFRAFRIEELLQKTERHDLESLRAIQCDVQSVDARFILPRLLALMDATTAQAPQAENTQRALKLLRDWNYETGLGCRPCALYRRWVDHIFALRKINATALYHLLLQDPLPEALPPAARMALLDALSDLGVDAKGTTTSFPTWGEVHRNGFQHLSNDPKFAVPAIPTPGDEHSINPGTAQWRGRRYEQTTGASHRLIVELTSPPTVYAALAGSNLDVESPNLADPGGSWMRWARCEQQRKVFPLDWAKVKTERVALDGPGPYN